MGLCNYGIYFMCVCVSKVMVARAEPQMDLDPERSDMKQVKQTASHQERNTCLTRLILSFLRTGLNKYFFQAGWQLVC